jgi:Tol biopolymer transport system component
LIIAKADGSGERVLATRKMPNGFTWDYSGPAWSPDGRVIAVGVETGDAPMVRNTVVVLNATDGREEHITPAHWNRVGRLAWISDGSGLLITAAEQLDVYQLWYLRYPSGETRRITNNESIDYKGLSLTADSQMAVTIQNDTTSRIWIAPAGDLSRARDPVTLGKYDGRHGLRWTHDGRIVYHSLASGSEDIWIMAADGTGQKQITFDPASDGEQDVSPDDTYIVFASQRGGGFDLWRTEITGNNTKQLTKGGARIPQITPDGKWVIFSRGGNGLWKVSTDGGEATQLNDKTVTSPAISPDGKLVACYYRDQPNRPSKLSVIPITGGDPIRDFDINGPLTMGFALRWTPDGRNITFLDNGTLWNQPLNGGKPEKLGDFKGAIRQFDWSRGGSLVFSVVESDSDVVLVRNSR